MKKLTAYQKRFAKLLIGSILLTAVMLLSVPSIGLINDGDMLAGTILLFLAFLVGGGTALFTLLSNKKTKFLYITCITNIVLCVALAVLSILASNSVLFVSLTGITFAISIVVNSVFSLIKDHRARNIVFCIFKFLFAGLLVILYTVRIEVTPELVLVFVPACLVVASFVRVMLLIFSGLRRKTLLQVIKKTYAIEILYGLVTLIVATAVMLTFWEDNFPTIGDALWYCFAVVTTIGFGDFVATTTVGRLLTVLLGVYGIIVVALITSIIVNFYNETSHAKDEVIIEEIEKLEEERKQPEDKNEQ